MYIQNYPFLLKNFNLIKIDFRNKNIRLREHILEFEFSLPI